MVVWEGFNAGDDNEQLRSEGYDPITNPYPGYTWEPAEKIKGDAAGSTGTAASRHPRTHTHTHNNVR